MNVKFLSTIKFSTCKSVFLSRIKNPALLPQCKDLQNFVINNNIAKDDIVQLVINGCYHSLTELSDKIVIASSQTHKYLYLAVNKFIIYSTVDDFSINRHHNNYDLMLVEYCHNLIKDKFSLVKYTVRPDDCGTIGNFIHPVTTMFFKRHD